MRVRAWDAANNASESTLTFTVAGDEVFTVRRVLNFPNPTTGATRFTFEHKARAGTAARVSVRVFTVGGQLVRALRDGETLPSGGLTSGRVTIPWDGRDEDGDRLAPGVYLYKVRVETDGENRQVVEHVERLVVVR